MVEDPLYLFTTLDFVDIVSYHLNSLLSPLVSYLRGRYGRPALSNGTPIDSLYLANIREVRDEKLEFPNFNYHTSESFPIETDSIWTSLLNMLPDVSMPAKPAGKSPQATEEWRKAIVKRQERNKGWTPDKTLRSISRTKMTVRVPNSLSHEFWSRGASFEWVPPGLGDGTELEVENFGDGQREANYCATQHALHIIESIRHRIEPEPCPDPIRSDHRNCEAFKLGCKLHDMWKNAEDDAFIIQDHEFWTDACRKLESLKMDFPGLCLLLDYYKVSFPPLFSVSCSPVVSSDLPFAWETFGLRLHIFR